MITRAHLAVWILSVVLAGISGSIATVAAAKLAIYVASPKTQPAPVAAD